MKDSYGPIEEDPEYSLIVSSNNLAAEVDHEISLVHKVLFVSFKL